MRTTARTTARTIGGASTRIGGDGAGVDGDGGSVGSGGGAKDVGDGDGEVEEDGEEGVRSLQTCQRVVYIPGGGGHKGGQAY